MRFSPKLLGLSMMAASIVMTAGAASAFSVPGPSDKIDPRIVVDLQTTTTTAPPSTPGPTAVPTTPGGQVPEPNQPERPNRPSGGNPVVTARPTFTG